MRQSKALRQEEAKIGKLHNKQKIGACPPAAKEALLALLKILSGGFPQLHSESWSLYIVENEESYAISHPLSVLQKTVSQRQGTQRQG